MVGLDAGNVHEGAHTGTFAALQDTQAVAGENAVLAGERHEIGHSAHRGEVKVVAQLHRESDGVVFGAKEFQQAVRQFKNEADGAEVVPRFVARDRIDMRVDEDALRERFFLGPVMVDDEHVDALRNQIGDLVVGVGAAVERDEEVGIALFQSTVDGAAREPIAVLHAARHDKVRVQPEAAENAHEQRGAAHAVHVVIAEHDHLFARLDGPAQTRGGGLHVGQQKRVVKLRQRGLEKLGDDDGIAKSVAHEQLGEDGAAPGGTGQRLDLVGRKRLIGPTHLR